MTHYDVFNGDADGICSLLQLRNNTPLDAFLITGIKRDIKLLAKVNAQADDSITVLDISLDKNRDDLIRNLQKGAKIFYADHHFSGEIPENNNLTALINTDSNICTSLIINQHLDNKFPLWAVTGAFGDNLQASAITLAKQHHLATGDIEQLQTLGVFINYNGYGADIDDLHFAPEQLYEQLLPYQNPLDVIRDSGSVFAQLKSGFNDDNSYAKSINAEYQTEQIAVFILPDKTWARRISGIFSNDLANQYPDRAHAVLSHNKQGGYLISVRAPLNNKTGADELCRQFESGGGRKAAAGINHLPKDQLDTFIDRFARQFK